MGNSPSLRGDFVVKTSEREKIPFHGKWKELNICLLCQRDSFNEAIGSPIDDVKESIINFLREVFDTSRDTVFNFQTWDTEDADIVLTKDHPLREPNTMSAFDVMVELHCEITCPGSESAPPKEDYIVMCRLLKERGLLVVPRSYDEVNHIVGLHPEYVCETEDHGPSFEINPIFSVGPEEEGTTDTRNLQNLAGGLTVFQKVKVTEG